jgi:hypothetical protein
MRRNFAVSSGRRLLAILSLLVVTTATEATAGNTHCIWQHLPLQQRNIWLAQLSRQWLVDVSSAKLPFSAQQFEDSARGCHAKRGALGAIQHATKALVIQTMSEKALHARWNISASALDRSWHAMSAKDHAELARGAKDVSDEMYAELRMQKILYRFARRVGVKIDFNQDDMQTPWRTYVASRLHQELWETQF